HLQFRIYFEVDRHEHRMPHGWTRDGRAMTAHQDGAVAAERASEIAAHFYLLDQERGIAELVVRIPGRHLVPDIGAHVQQGLQLLSGHAKWNHARTVVVHDRVNVRPRFVDTA